MRSLSSHEVHQDILALVHLLGHGLLSKERTVLEGENKNNFFHFHLTAVPAGLSLSVRVNFKYRWNSGKYFKYHWKSGKKVYTLRYFSDIFDSNYLIYRDSIKKYVY